MIDESNYRICETQYIFIRFTIYHNKNCISPLKLYFPYTGTDYIKGLFKDLGKYHGQRS